MNHFQAIEPNPFAVPFLGCALSAQNAATNRAVPVSPHFSKTPQTCRHLLPRLAILTQYVNRP
ncbi:hypothetical protein [Oxalobacter paraformigenes]|uniref:hypothetical protein n=1 Tax=Oxalobacter paraformigenes TaxID=556268 RepID=UPI0011CACA6B|nr:hypothetical protein [Oxalobacter paraformigenes]